MPSPVDPRRSRPWPLLFLIVTVLILGIPSTAGRSPGVGPAAAPVASAVPTERSIGPIPMAGLPAGPAAAPGTGGRCASGTTGAVPCPLSDIRPSTGILPTVGPLGNWTNITSSAGHVEPRRGHEPMVYDPALHVVVLYGGYDPENDTALGDTWEFANGTWTDVTSTLTSSPPPMWGDGGTYDAADGYLMIFGGRDTNGNFFNGTWTFNGSAWTQRNTPVAPSQRASASLNYDAADGYVLLQGGFSYAGNFNDTWTYAGGVWTDATSHVTGLPPNTNIGGGAYDAADGYVVFYGGTFPGACNGAGATYTYHAHRYQNITKSQTEVPQVTSGTMSMTYDANLQMVLMFSGYSQAATGPCLTSQETWGFSGGLWQNLTGAIVTAAPGRCCAPLAFDANAGYDIVTEGSPNSSRPGGLPDKDDTWVFPGIPKADIECSAVVGRIPLHENLTALVAGGIGPYNYSWTFSGGLPTLFGRTASLTIAAYGTYEVNLTVSNGSGPDRNATVEVTALGPIGLGLTATPSNRSAPASIAFTATPRNASAPVNYSWTWGDLNTSSGTSATAAHLYSRPGNYTVDLRAVDDLGAVATTSVIVHVFPTFGASITPLAPSGIAPFRVNLTAGAVGGDPPMTYQWSFGDGSSNATGLSIAHTYSAAGQYTLQVSVTDTLGEVRNATTTVDVVAGLIAKAGVTGASVGLAPFLVSFSGSPMNGLGPYTYSWEFGDASPNSTLEFPEHIYSTTGNYTATLTISDALGERARSSVVVQAVPALQATPVASSIAGDAPFLVHLSSALFGGSGPFTYRWAFGDGTPDASTASVNHTFAAGGAFNVSLVVGDALGEQAQKSLSITVGAPFHVAVRSDAQDYAVGVAFQLSATPEGGTGPFSYNWSGLPGGCHPASAPDQSCTPTSAGSYTVTVTVTDAVGGTTQGLVEVTVTAPPGNPTPAGSAWTIQDTAIVAGIALVAIGVVAAVLLRKRPPPPPPRRSAPTPPTWDPAYAPDGSGDEPGTAPP